MVLSSRRQANVDKAVALLKSQSIQVTGTTCNVGKAEDREKLVQMVGIFSFCNHRYGSETRLGCLPIIIRL